MVKMWILKTNSTPVSKSFSKWKLASKFGSPDHRAMYNPAEVPHVRAKENADSATMMEGRLYGQMFDYN